MLTRHAGIDFLSYADSLGVEVTRCDALTGVLTLLDWYEVRPADDVAFGDDTDVVTVHWGQQPGTAWFEIGASRTLVVPGAINAAAWRLTLAYRYEPSELTAALWTGNRACGSSLALPGLRSYFRGSLPGTFAKVAVAAHADVNFRQVDPVTFQDLAQRHSLAS